MKRIIALIEWFLFVFILLFFIESAVNNTALMNHWDKGQYQAFWVLNVVFDLFGVFVAVMQSIKK